MVKKLKPPADKKAALAASLLDGSFANSVKDSAQQIWLAGLGAFSKAQEEGSKVFDALVKDGSTLQKKTQTAAEEKLSDMSAKAGRQWDKLESIFEERTARALGKLGVPRAKDVAALHRRIDELSAQVAQLSKKAPGKTRAAAGPGAEAPAKPPRKRAPPKAV